MNAKIVKLREATIAITYRNGKAIIFTLLAGSKISLKQSSHVSGASRALLQELIASGCVDPCTGVMRISIDLPSATAVGDIVTGSHQSGIMRIAKARNNAMAELLNDLEQVLDQIA